MLRARRVRDIRIKSWNDLNDRLYEGALRESLSRHRSPFAFRGSGDARHSLETSLMRMGPSFERLETPMLRAFRKYAQTSPGPRDSIWNWLALAQHHGLPTRLLDWTYSPYVAMHFATRTMELYDVDGVIWCVDYTQVARLLPAPLRGILDEEGADIFTAEMLERAATSLTALRGLSEDPFVVFLEPPSVDARIVNQYALFALMSDASERFDHWLEDQSADILRRLIIPADLKWELRDKLDQANITERVLFPGLDGLSQWLRRYYTPRLSSASGAVAATEEPAEVLDREHHLARQNGRLI